MEIVEDYKFTASRSRGKYTRLIAEFLALPPGTTVRLVQGRDFEGDPKKFSLSLRTMLWTKGYKAQINVRPDGVYAALVGKREPTEAELAAGVTDPTVQSKPAAKTAAAAKPAAKRSSRPAAEKRSSRRPSERVSAAPLASPFAVPGR